MNSLIEKLSQLFGEAFEAQELPAELGKVVISGRPNLADFQCNGALQAAKQKKMNPRALAEAIVASLPENDWFMEVSIAGPGFINLRLNKAFLTGMVGEMMGDKHLGVRRVAESRTIIVDYGGYNVAKPLHVGHLRPTIIGQALVNIFRQLGLNVVGDVHLGDWGLQMGQLIAELAERMPDLPYFDEAYSGPYPEDPPSLLMTLPKFIQPPRPGWELTKSLLLPHGRQHTPCSRDAPAILRCGSTLLMSPSPTRNQIVTGWALNMTCGWAKAIHSIV